MLETARVESPDGRLGNAPLEERLHAALAAGHDALELGIDVPMTVMLWMSTGRTQTMIMRGAESEREIEKARQILHKMVRMRPVTCMILVEKTLWFNGHPERGVKVAEDPRTREALIAFGFTPREKLCLFRPYRRTKAGKILWSKIREADATTSMDHWNPWRHLT